jgi:hypothetical protein
VAGIPRRELAGRKMALARSDPFLEQLDLEATHLFLFFAWFHDGTSFRETGQEKS